MGDVQAVERGRGPLDEQGDEREPRGADPSGPGAEFGLSGLSLHYVPAPLTIRTPRARGVKNFSFRTPVKIRL